MGRPGLSGIRACRRERNHYHLQQCISRDFHCRGLSQPYPHQREIDHSLQRGQMDESTVSGGENPVPVQQHPEVPSDPSVGLYRPLCGLSLSRAGGCRPPVPQPQHPQSLRKHWLRLQQYPRGTHCLSYPRGGISPPLSPPHRLCDHPRDLSRHDHLGRPSTRIEGLVHRRKHRVLRRLCCRRLSPQHH